MKRLIGLCGIATLMLTVSCNQKKEPINTKVEKSQESNGIEIGEVYTTINDVETDSTSFQIGKKVAYIFDKVKGLKEENGKVYPGIEITILNNKKDTVLHESDLLSDSDGFSKEGGLNLKADFFSAFPYTNQSEYKAKVKIWDKKGEGNFLFAKSFTTKPNPAIKAKENGIDYGFAYLYLPNKKVALLKDELENQEPFQFIVNGLENFTLKNNKAYLQASLKILNDKKKTIIESPNILGEQTKIGVSPDEKGKLTFPVDLFFDNKVKGKVEILLNIQDTLSDKSLSFTISLDVKEK